MREWQEAVRERLASLRLRGEREAEIVEEVAQHLEARFGELLAEGVEADEARRQVLGELREFGPGLLGLREARIAEPLAPGAPGGGWLANLGQDLRFGLRSFRKQPVFAWVVIVTLALGIGATTAVYNLVDAVLLEPLPFPQAERLVWVASEVARFPGNPEHALEPDFVAWRERAQSFAVVAAYQAEEKNLSMAGQAVRLPVGRVSADFLQVLRTAPLLGRDFSREDEDPNAQKVALLTYGFWRDQFALDTAAVGSAIELDGYAFTVVGVLPREFVFPHPGGQDVRLLIPALIDTTPVRSGAPTFFAQGAIARLADGATVERATEELERIQVGIEEESPNMKAWDMRPFAEPLRERLAEEARSSLWILLGAAGLVFGIACLNVASLLFARGWWRARELAVRFALGARRSRIVGQLLVESALLALGGAVLGVAVAVGLRQLAIGLSPENVFGLAESVLDWKALAFAVGAAIAAALAAGLLPAWSASRGDVATGLKQGTQQSTGSRTGLGGLHAAVAAQTALSMVLLVGAALMLQSFQGLLGQKLGYDPENLTMARVTLDRGRYEIPQVEAFYRTLYERLGAAAGIDGASLALGSPAYGILSTTAYAEWEEIPEQLDLSRPRVPLLPVTPEYFGTMGIPLLRGEVFEPGQREGEIPIVVDEAFVAAHIAPREPLRARVFTHGGPKQRWKRIVGVVGNVRSVGSGEPPQPHIYMAYPFAGHRSDGRALLRSRLPADEVARIYREIVGELDPRQAISLVETFEQRAVDEAHRQRMLMWLLGSFAAIAVLLTAAGVYGLSTYAVRRRYKEMGLRLALGAKPGDVLGLVLRRAAWMSAAGCVAGLVLSVWGSWVLETYLFGVSRYDGATLVAAAGVLALVSVGAAYGPARRAARIDPAGTLRAE